MFRITSLCAVALLAAAAAAPASAAITPAAGVYNTQAVYTAVTATGGATSCPLPGSNFGFWFSYPGPGLTGAAFRSSFIKSGGFSITHGYFPKTPAAGATSWKGSVLETSSSGTKQTATFTATLTYFDADSFLGQFNWVEPQSTGACDETIDMTFIRSGAP